MVKDQDRSGRLVAEGVLPDGRSLNQARVRAGLAWWYRQFATHETLLLQPLEAEARDAKRGRWSDPHAVAPGRIGPSSTVAATRPIDLFILYRTLSQGILK